MRFVLTLIASDHPLTPAHLAGVMRYCDGQGLSVTAGPRWLDQHKAADILLQHRPNPDQMRDLRDALMTDRIDILVVNAGTRRKKIMLADMDSTIITGETLDDLAALVGKHDEVAAITSAAMNGTIGFREALEQRMSLLAGVSELQLHQTLNAMELSPGAALLVAGMRQIGAITVLVSSGFTFFTGGIAQRVGFTQHHGNVLDMQDGALTGRVLDPVLDKTAKLHFLNHYVEQLDITADDVLAIGDGSNDIPMLQAAGLGIGYHPKPAVAAAVDNLILHGDLTAALYAQGLIPKT
ncbi:phosphoserine phosphatase SerB [Micavibrio aeruginosavorus]|uniref:Phosphoserine phosphatase n=1 Tax=Micavibrio aeruginosavorus EPB TaxID=349215 RepID=M4VCH1_9BACT|nr:phosphoserine phosphatase SerB [Micavibrio aeruginosavorus]AGH96928.1 Phosphoserine phosphatase [Micavibrio aeruginosavorus EPB]